MENPLSKDSSRNRSTPSGCWTADAAKKRSLQGLKPIENTQFTSALKHRPPEEKDFFSARFSRAPTLLTRELGRRGRFFRDGAAAAAHHFVRDGNQVALADLL